MRGALLISFCFLLASCYKYIDVPKQNLDYNIALTQHYNTYAPGTSMYQYDSGYIECNAKLISGDPSNEYIRVSVSGYPGTMSLRMDSTPFRPNYSFYISFYSHNTAAGIYPLEVIFNTTSKGTIVDTIYVNIRDTMCSYYLGGKYNGSRNYNVTAHHYTGDTSFTCQISYYTQYGIEIPIPGGGMFAQTDCSKNTLRVMPQDLNGLNSDQIKGAGHFVIGDSVKMYITDTIYNGSVIKDIWNLTLY